MKITIVAGARPNFMKIAPITRAIEAARALGKSISYRLVYTGRKDDTSLDASLFSDLDMKAPDVYLGVESSNPTSLTAGIMVAFEQELTENPAQFLAEKEAEYTKLFANPYNAAKYGYIDDVIEPRNTRFRVIRALQQLQTKKLSNPAKKHGNIPL